MTLDQAWDLVIIGAGMAGLSTAIWARRLGLTALVLEQAPQAGGQLTAIGGRIFDYPGLDLPQGSVLTERLLKQAADWGVALRLDQPVLRVSADRLSCATHSGEVAGRALVFATGLRPRRLEVEGEEELYRRQLVRRPSHDLPWFRGRRVAVVGGGDRAVENALMLAPVARQVVLLTRGENLRARAPLVEAMQTEPAILHRACAHVRRFQAAGEQVRLSLDEAGRPAELEVDAVCIYVGNQPNTDLLSGQVALDAEGYVITDRYGQSSQPGLYAVGDVCTQPPYQSLSTAGGQAMVAAKHIALTCVRPRS